MRDDAFASRALAQMDSEISRTIAGRDRIVLAFSGGLGSLLVAALARKRCDLQCVVVGSRTSADVEAALVARAFLDYPVTVLSPSAERGWTVARQIRSRNPGLPLGDVLALVPLAFVEERHPLELVVSGFGLTARTPGLRRALRAKAGRCPGLRLRVLHSTRIPLTQMAQAAGLPISFIRAAPRSPLEGSGLGPALRALARSRKVSLDRLVSGDGPSRENQ